MKQSNRWETSSERLKSLTEVLELNANINFKNTNKTFTVTKQHADVQEKQLLMLTRDQTSGHMTHEWECSSQFSYQLKNYWHCMSQVNQTPGIFQDILINYAALKWTIEV